MIELLEIHHDRDMRSWQPALSVVPDGYMNFALSSQNGRFRFPILLEVDMATMDRKRWEEKITRYARFFEGEFQATFGTNAATVAVIVNGEQKRVEDLKRWTENELKAQQLDELSDVFYFALHDDTVTPAALFCSPRFQSVFSSAPECLLPLALPSI